MFLGPMRAILFGLLAASAALASDFERLAGTGASGASGDGGRAIAAQVGNPYGLTVGPDGALYVCEIDTHRIRRIVLRNNGGITTVAGSGKRGYSGDGGPATEAALDEPYEVRFGPSGDMFFVEMKNAVIRRVDRGTGKISTVAGTGESGFSGDGGPAVQATFNKPHSIAFDPQGRLYVADIGNHRIRRIDLRSGVVSTFAGTGEKLPTPDGAPREGTPLNGPRAMTFGPDGTLYLALREGNAVYRLDPKTDRWRHIAGTGEKGYEGDGGPAKQALLSGPKGIEIGPNGGLYIADTESHTIRRIDVNDGTIRTVLGDGERGILARPHGVFVDADGAVYVGDSENHQVLRVRP